VLKQWDLATGREMKTFRGHKDYINAVAISRDGKYAASASRDSNILLWDIETGRAVKTFRDTNSVTVVIFSPGGDVVTGNYSGAVKIWNIHTGSHRELKNDFSGEVLGLMFLQGKQLVVGGKSGFSVVDVQADRKRSFGVQSDKYVKTISFSSDGRYTHGRLWSLYCGMSGWRKIRTFKDIPIP
jgi:WD40 repeat protein